MRNGLFNFIILNEENFFFKLKIIFLGTWFDRCALRSVLLRPRASPPFLYFSHIFTLAKVSDCNSFRVNQNYSDSFRYLYPSQCESFRTNPKKVLYLIWWKTVKNQSDLIQLIPWHRSEWIRTSPKPVFCISFDEKRSKINPT